MFNVGETLLNCYQLKQQLGRTATGHQTWLAVDQRSQENVTIKLLAFSPQLHWQELKLFEREAQILQNLKHPKIPQYRDYFDLDKDIGHGIAWFGLVQDYIPGKSLQELLEKGKRFTEQEVYNIALEILEILTYLHELNPPVIHRDIKPSNLILGEDNHIYLIDFGAVQAQGAMTGVTFTVVGTSGYAPLEQFWGRATPSSDIYALGATLIHLLTGIAPADLPQKDTKIQFTDHVNIQPYFIDWLEQSTEPAIEKRFINAKIALNCLEKKQQYHTQQNRRNRRNKLKPIDDSRIVINHADDNLSIYFPPKITLKFANNVSIFVIIFLGSLLTFSIFPFSLLILLLAYQYLKDLEIVISHKSFYLRRKILSFTYQSINFPNNDIIGVFLYGNAQNCQVRIRTEKQSYLIGENLKEKESAWLAKEIQDWLYHQTIDNG